MAYEGWTGFHEDMILFISKNGNSLTRNREIINEFIEESSKFYGARWLDNEDIENKKTTIAPAYVGPLTIG